MIICILRDRRAESPKAHSLGHRPMYSEKTSSPCKGKSFNMNNAFAPTGRNY